MKNSLKCSDVCAIFGNFKYLSGDFKIENDSKVYNNSTLKITVEESKKESDVILRSDVIQNVSEREIELTCAQSVFCFYDGDYEVYTQYSTW